MVAMLATDEVAAASTGTVKAPESTPFTNYICTVMLSQRLLRLA